MILSFELSMPSNNSWNGKWSGEGNLYAIVKNFGSSKTGESRGQEILNEGYFQYSFGDGWRARITVKKVSPKEAVKIGRKSKGFCGYDWMVNSIINDLKIIPPPRPGKETKNDIS